MIGLVLDIVKFKWAFKNYVTALGVGRNADTADAGEGVGGLW